jgi:hypothetical protein
VRRREARVRKLARWDGDKARRCAEQTGHEREEIGERRRLVLAKVIGLSKGSAVAEHSCDDARHLAAIDVPHRVEAAVRHENRSAVEHSMEVRLKPAAVVALAVHHGYSNAGRREARFVKGLGERVLTSPLSDPVLPLRDVVLDRRP